MDCNKYKKHIDIDKKVFTLFSFIYLYNGEIHIIKIDNNNLDITNLFNSQIIETTLYLNKEFLLQNSNSFDETTIQHKINNENIIEFNLIIKLEKKINNIENIKYNIESISITSDNKEIMTMKDYDVTYILYYYNYEILIKDIINNNNSWLFL